MAKYKSSLLKWAGGKQKALDKILPIIRSYDFEIFVEPFIGAANVSLNVDADRYVWSDTNEDLINTYSLLYYNFASYVRRSNEYFKMGFEPYYELRDKFNSLNLDNGLECLERAALFQYLNKHGFNGLCRYNSKGGFNVPRGSVTKKIKSLPLEGISNISKLMHSKGIDLLCEDFESVILKTESYKHSTLIYSDPPYVPLTSDFKYTKDGFNEEDHVKLKELSKNSSHVALISNHWTEFTEELYLDADELYIFDVQRTISCKGGDRKRVQECLAIYK